MPQKVAGRNISLILAVSGIATGVLLRAWLVFVVYTPSDHVYSDMAGYVGLANRLISPSMALTEYDLIQPVGTSFLLAAIMKVTGGLSAANWLWFLMSSATPVFWFYVARNLAGIRVAAAVAWLTAIDIGHASFAAVFLSETPFAFLVAGGMACLTTAIRSDGGRAARFAVAAGAILGLSLLFRGHALAILFMLGTCWAFLAFKGATRNLFLKALVPFVIIMLICATYFSATFRRPMLTTLGMACQTLMGRLPDAAESRFEVPGTNIVHSYGSAAVHQRCPKNKYVFPFAVIDNGAAMREAIRRFTNEPVQFVSLSLRNANDTITGNDPWPPNQMPTLNWLRIFESLFVVFAVIPACAMVFPPLPREQRAIDVAVLALPVAGIWLIGLLTIGETRYRVPFDGMILTLACMKWAQVTKGFSRPSAENTH